MIAQWSSKKNWMDSKCRGTNLTQDWEQEVAFSFHINFLEQSNKENSIRLLNEMELPTWSKLIVTLERSWQKHKYKSVTEKTQIGSQSNTMTINISVSLPNSLGHWIKMQAKLEKLQDPPKILESDHCQGSSIFGTENTKTITKLPSSGEQNAKANAQN